MYPLSAISSMTPAYGVVPRPEIVPAALPTPGVDAPAPADFPGGLTPVQPADETFVNLLARMVGEVQRPERRHLRGPIAPERRQCVPAPGGHCHGGSQHLVSINGRSPQQTARRVPGNHAYAGLKLTIDMTQIHSPCISNRYRGRLQEGRLAVAIEPFKALTIDSFAT